MLNYIRYKYWTIWISFFIAIIIQILIWSINILFFKPNLLLLVLLYWILKLPKLVNIGTGFIIGIILDLISGSTLGIHALTMSLISYLIVINYRLFNNLKTLYQEVIIIILSIITESTIFLLEFLLIKKNCFHLELYWNSIINAIIWSKLLLLMDKIRHFFKIK